MGLRELLGNVIVEKDGKRVINDNCVPLDYSKADKTLKKLERLDLGSEGDLGIYKNLTQEKLGTDPDRMLEAKRRSYLRNGQEELEAYTEKHFNHLVEKEIPEQIQFRLGYLYCPRGDIKGEGNKKYNSVRKIVADARDKNKRIKENSQEYIAELVEGKASWMKDYLLRYPDEIIKASSEGAQRNAEIAIRAYGGTTEFLKDTKENVKIWMVKLGEEISELEKTIQTKLEPLENKKKRELSAMEKAKLIPGEHTKLLKLFGEYKDARDSYTKLIEDTQFYALGAIEERLNPRNSRQSPN